MKNYIKVGENSMNKWFGNEFKSTMLTIITMTIMAMAIYITHYLIFGQLRSTVSSLILSLAYVPIGVMFNMLILDRIFKKSNEIRLERRINIIIGSFFHEIGNDLINTIVVGDENVDVLRYLCDASIDWDDKNFKELSEIIKVYECKITIDKIDLKLLKDILGNKEEFILDLIINSNLDDYEGFGEMLMSILHVRDEFDSLFIDGIINERDKLHMTIDICRSYKSLLIFRVDYIKNLKDYYPLMFIRLMDNSPFRANCK